MLHKSLIPSISVGTSCCEPDTPKKQTITSPSIHERPGSLPLPRSPVSDGNWEGTGDNEWFLVLRCFVQWQCQEHV